MRAPSFLPAALLAMLGACAQQPVKPPAEPAPLPKAQGKPAPRVVIAKPAPRQPVLPKQDLTPEIMFKMVLAEVAMQRGQPHVAVPSYLELARETRDPRVAQRATEVAWNARYSAAALEAASIWLQSDPESPQARQVMAALLVNQERLAEAQPHLERWLAEAKTDIGPAFLHLNSLLARHKDKAVVFGLMRSLAKQYGNVPEARLAVAQAAWNAGDYEVALAEARAALELKPEWEVAALFQAQVLQRRSAGEAVTFLQSYLKRYPQAKDARLNYARLLVADKQYDEARREFEALLAEFPRNSDVAMAVALLSLQLRDYDAAEAQLKRTLEMGYKDPDAVRYYLGQVNEERKRFDDALKWYGEVAGGEQYVAAHARYAGILAKQGQLGDARAHLQQVAAQNIQQRVQLTQAEAQLLREAAAYREAFDLLGRALEKTPNSPDLLYDHAMAAEKVDRLDVLEANLRKLIEMRPAHAHAYNALGYTLADRSERLEEAHGLITKALELAPDDPFIMDSMGWVLYRMGNIKEGLDYLQRAYALRPDPEIAAHLGEVLWMQGRREEARKIWADSLKNHPRNEVLENTIKRLTKN